MELTDSSAVPALFSSPSKLYPAMELQRQDDTRAGSHLESCCVGCRCFLSTSESKVLTQLILFPLRFFLFQRLTLVVRFQILLAHHCEQIALNESHNETVQWIAEGNNRTRRRDIGQETYDRNKKK